MGEQLMDILLSQLLFCKAVGEKAGPWGKDAENAVVEARIFFKWRKDTHTHTIFSYRDSERWMPTITKLNQKKISSSSKTNDIRDRHVINYPAANDRCYNSIKKKPSVFWDTEFFT